MEILLPTAPPGSATVEPYDFYRRPGLDDRWLRVNMVSSIDGQVTDTEGVSGGLGGSGDRAAFRAQRALADAVVAGAGTVRAEGYGPYRLQPDLASRRKADGREAAAPIVVVSNSLRLDVSTRLFTESVARTIVVTSAASSRERRERLAAVADVIVVGEQQVDLAAGMCELRRRGLNSILCEGGPTLNAALLRAGLVDELCLTFAPRIMGDDGLHIVSTVGLPAAAELELAGVARDGDELFLRYLVNDAPRDDAASRADTGSRANTGAVQNNRSSPESIPRSAS